MIVTLDLEGTQGKIKCEQSILDAIREEFSVPNDAKAHTRDKAKARFIPSRLYSITPLGSFKPGMAYEIEKIIVANQLASGVVMTPALLNIIKPKNRAEFRNRLAFQLRDYQEEGLRNSIAQGCGICLLATGAGKTLLIAALVDSFCDNPFFKCLIIVPDLGLVTQTLSDFEKYKVPFTFSAWTGKTELDTTTQVIIVNQAVLTRRHEDNKWIQRVNLLIVDEVHTIKKNNVISTDIVKKIKSLHRFGFTGTLPPNKVDLWNVLGIFGKVIIERSSHELRELGYLADVEARILNLHYKNAPPRTMKYDEEIEDVVADSKYWSELHFIYNNEYRNNIIKQLCSGFKKNILILVNHREHGEVIHGIVSQLAGKSAHYIHGGVDTDIREEIKKRMEEEDGLVITAMSRIFSTGISINNVHMIMFAAGGKAFVRVVQSIGRGLRLHPNKHKLMLIDIHDVQHYGDLHSEKRTAIYDDQKIRFSLVDFIEK